MFRLKIVEYFDSLRNELDLFTETKIRDEIERESFWNERREKQLEAIRELEQAELLRVKKRIEIDSAKSEELETMCFLLEYSGMTCLAKTNRHVNQKEIDSLKGLLRFHHLTKQNDRSTLRPSLFLLNRTKAEMDELAEFLESSTPELAVVDMSWWFKKDPLLINVQIKIFILDCMKDAFDLIEKAQRCFDNTGEFILDVKIYPCLNSLEKVVRFLHQIKWSEHTIPVISIKDRYECRHQDFQDYCLKNNLVGWLNRAFVGNSLVDVFSQINWGHLVEIRMHINSPSNIKSSMFANICSLRRLKLLYYDEGEIDWSFLDPVRASLEVFKFISHQSKCTLSWRIFQGMTKLEDLNLVFRTNTIKVDADAQGQVFADLVQLKSLDIYVYAGILTQEWRLDALALEKIKITFLKCLNDYDSKLSGPIKMRTNLPKLAELDLNFNYNHCHDMSSFLASCSHVRKLRAHVRDLKKGWFREFKNLRTLACFTTREQIDRDVFVGFENITTVMLENKYDGILSENMFNDMAHLKRIYLKTFNEQAEELSHSDNRMLDGVLALEKVYISLYTYFDETEQVKSVFFENLNKYVTVKTYR